MSNLPAQPREFVLMRRDPAPCAICERASIVVIITDNGSKPMCDLCMAQPRLVEAIQDFDEEEMKAYLEWARTQPEVFEPEQQPFIDVVEL